MFYKIQGTVLSTWQHRNCADGCVRIELVDSIDLLSTDWKMDEVFNVFNPSY